MTTSSSTLRDELRRALGASAPSNADVYRVFGRHGMGRATLLVAAGATNDACLLILDADGQACTGLSTRSLRVRFVEHVVVETPDAVPWSGRCLVLECADSSLLDAFSALGDQLAALGQRVGRVTWSELQGMLSAWSVLFAQATKPSEEHLLGLWGELLVLSSSSRPNSMLKSWRGAEGGVADFVLSDLALEVKTSTRPLSHHLSHGQLELTAEATYFLSLTVETGPGGTTISDLVEQLSTRLSDITPLYSALANLGISLVDLHEYDPSRSLIVEPLLFSLSAVPRVRSFDAGVTELRYRVLLDRSKALAYDDARPILSRLGLEKLLERGLN